MQMEQKAYYTIAFRISQCNITNFSDLSGSFNLVCQQVIVTLFIYNQIEMYAINIIKDRFCWMVDKVKLCPICSSCV